MIKMNRKIILLTLIIFVGSGLLIFTQTSKAAYTSQIDIDCVRDSSYDLELQTKNYEFWYANSDSKHYIFMNYTFDLTGQTIILSTTGFNEDISAVEVEKTYLHSLHENNLLEFEIDRSVISNRICISVNSNDVVLMLSPKSQPSDNSITPPSEEEDKGSDKNKPQFTLGDFVDSCINKANKTPGLWFLFSLFFCMMIIRVWRVCEKPYTYVQKQGRKYKKEYIGRPVSEGRSKELPGYWRSLYKKNSGIDIYYSKMNQKELKQHMFNSIAYMHQYYPHIIHMVVKLLPSLQFNEQERKSGGWNTFKYVVYRLVCIFIPSGRIAESFYNRVEFVDKYEMIVTKKQEVTTRIRKKPKIIETKEYNKDANGNLIPVKVTEINVLQHEYLMKKMKHVCDVSYQRYIIDETKDKIVEDQTEKGVPEYYIDDLKKDPTVIANSIEQTKSYKVIEEVTDMKTAINEKHAMDEIISIYEMERAVSDKKIQDLTQKFHTSRNLNRQLKNDIKLEIENAITKYEQQQIFDADDIPSIMGKVATIRKLSGKKFEAVKLGIINFIEEKFESTKQLDDKSIELEVEKRTNQRIKDIMKETRRDATTTINITENEEEEREDNILIR